MSRRTFLPGLVAFAIAAAPSGAQHFGDSDFNGVVDLADYAAFQECVSGPGVAPNVGCWLFDFDLDVDVDLDDFGAFQRAFAASNTTLDQVAGLWQGTGTTTDGDTFGFQLTLAQWGHRIFGVGELNVDPGDFLNGRPAFHLSGSIHDNVMVLGMSASLTNLCFLHSFDSFIATLELDPVAKTITLTNVVDYLPATCDQVVADFTVSRIDVPFEPGNADILGTWSGDMRLPAGWFYAPTPFFHKQKSFEESKESVLGFIETTAGGLWVPMALEWDPSMQTASYRWACEAAFTYEGRIDGNKFSGVLRWAFNPTETFEGVFVHTLQDEFVPPVPLDPKCGPSPEP